MLRFQSSYSSFSYFRCVKCCLQQTNDFVILLKLRESIASVLVLMNSFRGATENVSFGSVLESWSVFPLFYSLFSHFSGSCREDFILVQNLCGVWTVTRCRVTCIAVRSFFITSFLFLKKMNCVIDVHFHSTVTKWNHPK